MKTTPLDYIVSFASFGAVLGVCAWAVVAFVTPLTRGAFGDFHVAADGSIWLFSVGMAIGFVVRAALLFRPLKTGEYGQTTWEASYFKWLSMSYYAALAFLSPFTHVGLRPLTLKLFGAKVGSDAAIGGFVDCPWLVSIGDRSTIGNGANVAGSFTISGKIVVGPIKIGRDVTVGMNAAILPNVEIGDGAVVEIGSVVVSGTIIPAGENWKGNPARLWLPAGRSKQ